MLIMMIVVTVLVVGQTFLLMGIARNVERLIKHEISKMEDEKQQWYASNPNYASTFTDQIPSDGVDLPQLK